MQSEALRKRDDRGRLKRLYESNHLRAKSQELSSHQLPSHHIQGHLSSEAADELAISGELPLHHFGSTVAGQGVKHQTHGFFRASAGGPSDSPDSPANRPITAGKDGLGQSRRLLPPYPPP